MNRYVGLI